MDYIFIVSHLGSGASMLCESFDKHPHIARGAFKTAYTHINDLELMKFHNPYVRIHYDKLCFNYQFAATSLYKCCKFIYVVREASPTLNHISRHYHPIKAADYYCYRLRRLCEMARKTPNSLLFTWDNLPKSFPLIQKYIGIKKPLESTYREEVQQNNLSYQLIENCQKKYEKYLYQLKSYIN